MNYMMALESTWSDLIEWTNNGLFVPVNEESIQCHIYRGIVNHFQSAVGVFPKATHGKLSDGDMNFPDLVLGDQKQIVVEIKFARSNSSIFSACKGDVLKMKDKHGDAKRVFILFSENINSACLNKKQRDELQAHDPECLLLLYPEQLSQPASPAKLLFEIQSVDLYKSKRRKFLKSEIEHIRNRVNDGDSNVHLLSKEFDCSWQQIAGIKARMQISYRYKTLSAKDYQLKAS